MLVRAHPPRSLADARDDTNEAPNRLIDMLAALALLLAIDNPAIDMHGYLQDASHAASLASPSLRASSAAR